MKAILKRRLKQAARGSAGAWSVVLIDGRPVRNKAHREYQKAVRDLEKARAESERFQTEDKPLFAKWVNSNFGALLTEIRELQTKLFELEDLVNEVQQEHFFGGHRSIADAYREVMHRRTHPEEPKDEAEMDEEENEEFRREFEEFEKSAEDYWEKLGNNNRKNPAKTRDEGAPKTASRLKQLYRALVRRLHPDKTHQLSAREKEWWHLAQAAYQQGNADQLEVILTLLEIEDKGTKETSVSALARLTASFKKSLRALKRQLGELRRDPAWNFSQRADHSVLLHQTRLALQMDKAKTVWLLSRYEAQVQRWRKQTEAPPKRARSRRRREWQDRELF